MSLNRKLISGAMGGMLFSAVGMTCSFVQLSILLRRLPVEAAGIWLIFTNLGSYAMFLDLGLTPTLGREISFASAHPEWSEAERARRIATLIQSCTFAVAALSLLVLLVGGGFGWMYLRTIAPAAMLGEIKPAWFLFIFAAAINLTGQGWFAGIYGLGEVFQEKVIRSISAVLGLALMATAVSTHRGFVGLALAFLVQSVVGVVMARVVLVRATTHAEAKGSFDWKVIRGLINPSLKYAATLLGGILILQTDNIVIASTLGANLVPNYQAVARIVTTLMMLAMMLVMTSMPHTSQAYARGDTAAVIAILNRNLRIALGVVIVIGSFFACSADRVLAVWLGANHFVGFPVVCVLLVVALLEAYAQAMAAATISTGRVVFVAPALIAGVVNIALSVLLAHKLGLLGVVLGTMLAQALTNHWYVPWYTLRLFRIDWKQHVREVLLPAARLLGFLLLLNFAVRVAASNLSNAAAVAANLIATAVAGALCFGGLMLTPKERAVLLSRLRKSNAGLPAIP